MTDRTTRLVSAVALSVAVIALAIAAYSLKVAQDRTEEIERLRESIERATAATSASGGRPPLGLDPGEDP